MMIDVVVDECGDKVVGVVIAILHTQRQRRCLLRCRLFEVVGQKLILGEKVVRSTLCKYMWSVHREQHFISNSMRDTDFSSKLCSFGHIAAISCTVQW